MLVDKTLMLSPWIGSMYYTYKDKYTFWIDLNGRYMYIKLLAVNLVKR